MRRKVVSAEEAITTIRDGDTLCCSGFVGNGVPVELILALEKRFLETGSPKGLTLLFGGGQGDGKERGLNHLGARRPGAARHRRPLGPGAEAAGSWRSPTRSRPTTCRRASSPTCTATSPPASPAT